MKLIWIIRRKENKNTCETLLTNLTILWEELIDVIMFFRGYIMINFKMINVTRHVSLNHFSSKIYPLCMYLNRNAEIFNHSYICSHAHEVFIYICIFIFSINLMLDFNQREHLNFRSLIQSNSNWSFHIMFQYFIRWKRPQHYRYCTKVFGILDVFFY